MEKYLKTLKISGNKHGIGHTVCKTSSSINNFTKRTKSVTPRCHFCCSSGHYSYSCKLKRLYEQGVKLVWKPKGNHELRTNLSGPKKWVPKQ